jgi:putative chitinase
MITAEQLKSILPFCKQQRIEIFIDPLNETMREFDINSKMRVCAFIAQIAHESGSLNYVKELADGKAYEGRIDLGNYKEGDGIKFKGRGLIQLTGRRNYEACSKALGLDLISKPELLEDPKYASLSAGWFWKLKGLNELADSGDLKKITLRINGGMNGWSERMAFYKKALEIIK